MILSNYLLTSWLLQSFKKSVPEVIVNVFPLKDTTWNIGPAGATISIISPLPPYLIT